MTQEATGTSAAQAGHEIVLELTGPDQLFDDVDRNPLRNPRMLGGGMDTILERVKDLPRGASFSLTLELPPDKLTPELEIELPRAIRTYCDYRMADNDSQGAEVKRLAWHELWVAVPWFIPFALGSAALYVALHHYTGDVRLSFLLAIPYHIAFIVLWVILWMPVEAYLFDWRPFPLENRNWERIKRAPVAVLARPRT